ncbi:hypothetical protein D3C75_679120 [compost metagenome]
MNHFRAVRAAFRFTIGKHAFTVREAVFHCGVEVEKPHRQDAGTVRNLAGHHTAAAKTDITVQHFTFYRGVYTGYKVVNRVEMGAVFVAKRKVEKKILNGIQANFGQFTALAGAHSGKRT